MDSEDINFPLVILTLLFSNIDGIIKIFELFKMMIQTFYSLSSDGHIICIKNILLQTIATTIAL